MGMRKQNNSNQTVKKSTKGQAQLNGVTALNSAKLSSIELKYKFNSVSNVAISQDTAMTGILNNPTGGIGIPVPGDDISNREGRVITIKSIKLKGIVSFLGAEAVIDTPCGQAVFLALVMDKQPNGAVPTTSDIFTNTAGTIYTNTTPFRNPNGLMRFEPLAEKRIVKPYVPLSQLLVNDYSWPSHSEAFEFDVRFKKGKLVRFNQVGGGTIADVVTNAFHMLAVTGGDTIGALTSRMDCTLSYNVEVAFYG
jgi:hypothetical protein